MLSPCKSHLAVYAEGINRRGRQSRKAALGDRLRSPIEWASEARQPTPTASTVVRGKWQLAHISAAIQGQVATCPYISSQAEASGNLPNEEEASGNLPNENGPIYQQLWKREDNFANIFV